MNEMRQPFISKVVVNIGMGDTRQETQKAVTLLERLTGQAPVKTVSQEGSRTFGERPGLDYGAKVTLRGDKATQFLERVLQVKETLPRSSFTDEGNVSFGIEEYLDVPGIDYDPQIGMSGFDVVIVVERPGYRVKKRDVHPTQVGPSHKVTKQDAIHFLTNRFEVDVK